MLKITITNDFRNLKKGDVYLFDFFPILVAGENGCGKSSLFRALRAYKDDFKSNYFNDEKLKENIEVDHDYDKIFFYDSIRDDGSRFDVTFDAVDYVNSGAFTVKNLSHGESSLIKLIDYFNKIEKLIIPNKSLIILDEVDKGFGIVYMNKYHDILQNLSKKYNIEIIAISHNILSMSNMYLIFDFNSRELVVSSKYIKEKTNFTLTKEI